MDRYDPASLQFCWERLAEMHLSSPPPGVRPLEAADICSSISDPLTVEETDLERRCLGTLTDALRVVICYAHSSYKIPISFQVKRFDRAHGQIWVKVSPEEVPEGFDLKYLLQHIKFYENIPRYAEMLSMDDYKLRGICQYFLDLQSKAVTPKSEDPLAEIGRVRETISRASKWVHDMMNVGITDRDVVQQLKGAQCKLRDCGAAVDKFSTFQQNQTELVRLSGAWFPEKQQRAALSIHQQMQHLMDDPAVVKYMLHVVGPRLGLVPFQFTPPTPGHLLARSCN
jgi:hypothetical protein